MHKIVRQLYSRSSVHVLPSSTLDSLHSMSQIGWTFQVNVGGSVSSCEGVHCASSSEMKNSKTANVFFFAIQLDLQVTPSSVIHYDRGNEGRSRKIGSIQIHISKPIKNYDWSQVSSCHITMPNFR